MKEPELVPGVKSKPFFARQGDYESFRRGFEQAMKPVLDDYAVRRARSEEDVRHHFVD